MLLIVDQYFNYLFSYYHDSSLDGYMIYNNIHLTY